MKTAPVPENPLLLITNKPIPFVQDAGVQSLDDTSPRLAIKKQTPMTTKPIVSNTGLHYRPDEPIGKQFHQLTLEEEVELCFDSIIL